MFQTKDYKTKDSPPLGTKDYKTKDSPPLGIVFQTKDYKKTKDSPPLGIGGSRQKTINFSCSRHKTIKLMILMYRSCVFQTKDYKTKDSPPLGIGAVCSRQKTIKLKILLPYV